MTVRASASAWVNARPQEILEFVLDVHRYKEVDSKLVRVGKVVGPDAEGHGSARLWGRVKGLPPAPDQQNFTLERWSRLTFTGAPRQPGRAVFDFTGTFVCEPSQNDGTNVTHSYEFAFNGPFRFVERKLGPWLQNQVEEEVADLAVALRQH